MLNKNLIKQISKNLKEYQSERNQIIKQSREVLQASKSAIFAVHQGDNKKAEREIEKAEKILKKLSTTYDKGNRLRFEGSYKAGLEEYVEAKFFYSVMQGKKLSQLKAGNIGPEEYIGGLADMTGELVRQATLQSIDDKFENISKYRDLTEEIIEFMMKLYLTGHSRQKFDHAKRNLKRLEEILYQIKIRKLEDNA